MSNTNTYGNRRGDNIIMYSVEEQEIHIWKSRLDETFTLEVTDRTWLTKLLKFAEPINPEYDEKGSVVAAEFQLDLNQIIVRKKPKKREMSEEDKSKVGERLMKARGLI